MQQNIDISQAMYLRSQIIFLLRINGVFLRDPNLIMINMYAPLVMQLFPT